MRIVYRSSKDIDIGSWDRRSWPLTESGGDKNYAGVLTNRRLSKGRLLWKAVSAKEQPEPDDCSSGHSLQVQTVWKRLPLQWPYSLSKAMLPYQLNKTVKLPRRRSMISRALRMPTILYRRRINFHRSQSFVAMDPFFLKLLVLLRWCPFIYLESLTGSFPFSISPFWCTLC